MRKRQSTVLGLEETSGGRVLVTAELVLPLRRRQVHLVLLMLLLAHGEEAGMRMVIPLKL